MEPRKRSKTSWVSQISLEPPDQALTDTKSCSQHLSYVNGRGSNWAPLNMKLSPFKLIHLDVDSPDILLMTGLSTSSNFSTALTKILCGEKCICLTNEAIWNSSIQFTILEGSLTGCITFWRCAQLKIYNHSIEMVSPNVKPGQQYRLL